MKISLVYHIYLDKDLCKTTQISTLKYLNKSGNNANIFVPSNNMHNKKQKNVKPIYVFSKNSFISSPIFNLILFFYLPYYLKKKKIDFILFDYTSALGVISSIIASKLSIINSKFIFTVRSPPVEGKGLSGLIRRLQYFLTIKLCWIYDGMTFLTQMMKDEECRKYNIKNKNIGIWTTGVDESIFKNKSAIRKDYLIRKVGLKKGFTIIYHGVITHKRGLQQTIKAISKLGKYKDINFLILGDGAAKSELQKLIKSEKLNGRVIIFGPVNHEEVPDYISIADVGIVPLPNHKYWNSQSSLKLLEYLAMEKPAIVTDIPAHRMIIGECPCGIYVSSNQPQKIAEAIIQLYSKKSDLVDMGKEGRKIILKNYSWSMITNNLIKFLEKI